MLARIGDKLMRTYWDAAPFTAISPLIYYPWMDVHNVAAVFQTLGSNLGGLTSEIRGRAGSYDRLAESLNKELLRVSEQLNKYAP